MEIEDFLNDDATRYSLDAGWFPAQGRKPAAFAIPRRRQNHRPKQDFRLLIGSRSERGRRAARLPDRGRVGTVCIECFRALCFYKRTLHREDGDPKNAETERRVWQSSCSGSGEIVRRVRWNLVCMQ